MVACACAHQVRFAMNKMPRGPPQNDLEMQRMEGVHKVGWMPCFQLGRMCLGHAWSRGHCHHALIIFVIAIMNVRMQGR
jgi:hypothetical protein